MRLLIACVVFALSVVSLTAIVRALPLGRLQGRKTFACDVCMAFWLLAVLAFLVFQYVDRSLAWVALPAHGLAVLCLRLIRPPPSLDAFKETSP